MRFAEGVSCLFHAARIVLDVTHREPELILGVSNLTRGQAMDLGRDNRPVMLEMDSSYASHTVFW